MRSEGKKRTLELSLIQGFSKIEKLFGGATSTTFGFILFVFILPEFIYIPNNYAYISF